MKRATAVAEQVVHQDALLRRSILLMQNTMQSSHLPARQFAARANVSVSTVYRWRNRKNRTSLVTTMEKVLRVTGHKLAIVKV